MRMCSFRHCFTHRDGLPDHDTTAHDDRRRATPSLEASTTEHFDDAAILLRTHAKCAELCYNINVTNQRS